MGARGGPAVHKRKKLEISPVSLYIFPHVRYTIKEVLLLRTEYYRKLLWVFPLESAYHSQRHLSRIIHERGACPYD